jgi:hypothetical protein
MSATTLTATYLDAENEVLSAANGVDGFLAGADAIGLHAITGDSDSEWTVRSSLAGSRARRAIDQVPRCTSRSWREPTSTGCTVPDAPA